MSFPESRFVVNISIKLEKENSDAAKVNVFFFCIYFYL